MNAQTQIPRLVSRFVESTIQQTEAIRSGSASIGNRHARRRTSAFQQLRKFGTPGRDALVPLLSHERPDVRETAAVYLLRHKTQLALEVLNKEAQGNGLTAFGAQQAIKRWEEGTWNLDPV